MVDDAYNVGLGLGLGVGGYYTRVSRRPFKDEPVSKSEGSRSSPDDDEVTNNTSRKKLRLTKEQSSLLEDTFNLHTTLNPAQKQTLAEQLNLKPRQFEVWFQNRRARTKLKQTEVDCEFLKRCCEELSDENRRLKKELQELKAARSPSPPPFYVQLQKVAVCPSCSAGRSEWRSGQPEEHL